MTLQEIVKEVESAPEEKQCIIQKPAVITDEFIAEEVWDRKSSPQFAVYTFATGEFKFEPNLTLPGNVDKRGRQVIYEPLDNDHLREGVVIIPEKPVTSTFEEAFNEGCDLALQLYDCEPSKVADFKLNIAIAQSSFFYDKFVSDNSLIIAGMGKFAPIIAYRGMSGGGKGRALNGLRFNCYRPFYDQSTTRIPSLFRPLHLWQNGSLCLEECDFAKTEETSELIHFLNCRCYGVPISRQNPEAGRQSDVFRSFGLTAVTQRRAWKDNATESRSIPFYCEISQKDIATAEPDEWLRRGMNIQNKLLYLRMKYWKDFTIDKAARIQGLKDHRLTASVLPIMSLQKYAPHMVKDILAILLEIERRRTEVKAQSSDGLVINAIWDHVEQEYVGHHDTFCYVGIAKEVVTTGEQKTEIITPMIAKQLQDRLNWKGRLGNVLNSLQLVDGTPKPSIKVNGDTYRPIWFSPHRLEVRLCEFVPDYERGKLYKLLPNVAKVSQVTGENGAIVPDDTLSQWLGTSPLSPSSPQDPVTEATKVTIPNPEAESPTSIDLVSKVVSQVQQFTARTRVNDENWVDRADLTKEIGFDNITLLTAENQLETHQENFALVRLKQNEIQSKGVTSS